MEKIKTKIEFYKMIITLLWTALIVLIGGIHSVNHANEPALFQWGVFSAIVIAMSVIGLTIRTKYWINKIED